MLPNKFPSPPNLAKARVVKFIKCVCQVINGAGHYVFLDKPELFNKFVAEACAGADEAPPRQSGGEEGEGGQPAAPSS